MKWGYTNVYGAVALLKDGRVSSAEGLSFPRFKEEFERCMTASDYCSIDKSEGVGFRFAAQGLGAYSENLVSGMCSTEFLDFVRKAGFDGVLLTFFEITSPDVIQVCQFALGIDGVVAPSIMLQNNWGGFLLPSLCIKYRLQIDGDFTDPAVFSEVSEDIETELFQDFFRFVSSVYGQGRAVTIEDFNDFWSSL